MASEGGFGTPSSTTPMNSGPNSFAVTATHTSRLSLRVVWHRRASNRAYRMHRMHSRFLCRQLRVEHTCRGEGGV